MARDSAQPLSFRPVVCSSHCFVFRFSELIGLELSSHVNPAPALSAAQLRSLDRKASNSFSLAALQRVACICEATAGQVWVVTREQALNKGYGSFMISAHLLSSARLQKLCTFEHTCLRCETANGLYAIIVPPTPQRPFSSLIPFISTIERSQLTGREREKREI